MDKLLLYLTKTVLLTLDTSNRPSGISKFSRNLEPDELVLENIFSKLKSYKIQMARSQGQVSRRLEGRHSHGFWCGKNAWTPQ